MPTMAIAGRISRLPYESRSRSIDRLTLAAPDPLPGKNAQASHRADDCQGKEESENYMGHHQHSIDSGNAETEHDLFAPSAWRRRRIGHHVKGVENESDAGHRY